MNLLISPCRQLLTLSGNPLPRAGSGQRELSLIERGAILIEGETIAAAGTVLEIEGYVRGKPTERLSADGCVVMPGFVDSHTHSVFVNARADDYEMRILGASYQQIAERGGGILSTVRSVRSTSTEQLIKLTQKRLKQFLQHGTTTLEAKSGYGLDLENELKLLKIIKELQNDSPLELVSTFLGAHEIPEEFKNRKQEYVDFVIQEMIPRVAQSRLAEFCDCFVEEKIFSVEQAERILLAAKKYDLKIKLHADQLTRTGATQLGVRLGAISVDHLEQISAEDIEALKDSSTIATLLPGSVFHLGLQQYPPARQLIGAGVPVALATDFNPGSSPTLNMQMILSIACTQMGMTPAEAIVAATINGAHAVGRSRSVGSLEPEKQADLCIMDVEDYRQIPCFFGMNHCKMTIKKGKIVYQREL